MFKSIDVVKGSKGFTVVEMVITMSIGLIGALGGYALLANVQGTLSGNTAMVEAQQEARIIIERITRELRESTSDKISPVSLSDERANYIYFETPRDGDRVFIVDSDGKPVWQRVIAYWLGLDPEAYERGETEPTCLYRYEYYTAIDNSYYEPEVLSKNVDQISFGQNGDMVSISIRTFADHEGKVGHVARTYADIYTEIKLRN